MTTTSSTEKLPECVEADAAVEARASVQPRPSKARPSSEADTVIEAEPHARAMRADAKRNYDKIVTAARETFAENGSATSLEAVARRAGVGIGTLYRHFPTRQALLEAVYIGEVQTSFCSATQGAARAPALGGLRCPISPACHLSGDQEGAGARADELRRPRGRLLGDCRADLFIAGEPVLRRAQEAKVVRADTNFTEIIQLVGGIAKIEETAERPA